MPPQVHNQIGRVGERPTAVHAQLVLLLGGVRLVRRLLLVDLHVRPQIVLPVELLMALGTFELLLRRDVDLDVSLEVLQALEALAANLTNVLLFLLAARFRFDPQWPGGFVLHFGMLVQTGLPHELLVAERAQELLVLILALLFHVAQKEFGAREAT